MSTSVIFMAESDKTNKAPQKNPLKPIKPALVNDNKTTTTIFTTEIQ